MDRPDTPASDSAQTEPSSPKVGSGPSAAARTPPRRRPQRRYRCRRSRRGWCAPVYSMTRTVIGGSDGLPPRARVCSPTVYGAKAPPRAAPQSPRLRREQPADLGRGERTTRRSPGCPAGRWWRSLPRFRSVGFVRNKVNIPPSYHLLILHTVLLYISPIWLQST
jgi:hypothetical protein